MQITKSELINNNLLPEKAGLMLFKSADKILFSLCVLDLKQKFEALKKQIKNNSEIFTLFSKSSDIEWFETDSLLDALIIKKKKLFNKPEPEYNPYFYRKYIYFGIDFKNVPYFQIKNDTTSERIFLGPFHSRFFVWDFILVMNELYKYPACESKDFPCELYDKNLCIASCLKGGAKEIILENYIVRNEKMIKELSEREEKLSNNLKFYQAEDLKKRKNIILKFYKYLKFFYVTKDINCTIKDDSIIIRNGLIKKIRSFDSEIEFSDYNIEYNKNEFLAFEKMQLNERWIIFDYLLEQKSELIEEIYEKNKKNYINMRLYE